MAGRRPSSRHNRGLFCRRTANRAVVLRNLALVSCLAGSVGMELKDMGGGQLRACSTTGNANVARRYDHELTGRKGIGVFLQRLIQVLNLGLQLGLGKPEEQDADVGQSLVEDQLAEIAIGNDQNPLLLPGDRQDILIGKTGRVVSRDG
jgi:hypothetical protein